MSNPIKRLLGQTAVYGLSSIVGRLLNYLLVPLYTAVFADPADYGVVSELYAWVAFLVVFLTFGMETAFFRFIQDATDRKKIMSNALWVVLLVNAFFYLLLLQFNNEIANVMLFQGHNEYIVLMGAIVCIDAVSALPLAELRAEEKARRFATIQLLSIAVNIGLNVLFMVFLFNKSRPEEGVLFILIANLLASLVKPILLADSFGLLRLGLDKETTKKMLIYAFPLVIAGFAGIINETLDRILLKQLLFNPSNPSSLRYAEAQVGIYSACYKLAMLVTILLQAYRYAAEPFFFNQYKNEDRNKVYVRVMNLFVATVCFVFLLVSLNIDVFKYFIRNEAYWVGLKVVPILLLANVFLGIYYNQSIWYKLSGKTKFGAYIAIVGAIITVSINWLFIPTYGFMASAWATLIVYAFQMVLSYYLGQKHFPIPYNLRKFALYLLAALGVFGLSYTFKIEGTYTRLFIHNIFLLAYAAMIYNFEKKSFQFGNRNTK